MKQDDSSRQALPIYLDFDLEISAGGGREYPVVARSFDGAVARATMRFPFDELALENHLLKLDKALLRSGGRRRQVLSPEQQAVRDFGRALFDALLTDEIRSRYDVSLREATGQDCGLRLRLHIAPPELASLPWEYLYDPRQGEYVCLCSETPIVRYLDLPSPVRPLKVTPPLQVLGMIASPAGLPALDVDREKQRLEKALADLTARGLVTLTWLSGQTWRDLQRAMRTGWGPWHVFHFIGHGGFDRVRDEGLLALADEAGKPHLLQATQVSRLLGNHRTLRLAVLNACEGARGGERDIFSSTASILVRRGIPAVLSMQHEISDRAAIEFARTFYEALAEDLPVDAAVTEARVGVSLAVANTVEWGTPVLHMRSRDGVLFDLAEAKVEVEDERSAEAAPSMRQGDRPDVLVIDEPVHMELVHVPAGEFLMGSDPAKDELAFDSEQPQQRIYLPEFYIGKYPVTNAQYAAYVKATGTRAPKHGTRDRIPSGKENHPVVNVSWHDAVAFYRWLREATGKPFRLPTEAEWEKAARGADGRIYPWGDEPPDETFCNFNGNIGDTTPVDDYPAGASPYGALDMAGNVWEWCRTKWRKDYREPADEDLDGVAARVLRGGSFLRSRRSVRCAFRYGGDPDCRVGLGFRVVVSPIDSDL